MTMDSQVRDLESALLNRARLLVREHLDKAAGERDRLLRECGQRLRLREERETLAAKADAERLHRQRVQAAEIALQGELDRLRWTLVQSVMGEVRRRLAALAADDEAYLPALQRLIASGAQAIGEEGVVVQLNARDHQRFGGRWAAISAALAAGRRLELLDTACEGSGGAVIMNRPQTLRVDNTFEGRIERAGEAVSRRILERLFAAVPEMESLSHG